MSIFYFQGQYVPEDQAKISIRTNAFLYGTSLFEGVRGYWNADDQTTYLFRAMEHHVRMLENGKLIFMDTALTPDNLMDICTELVQRNNFQQDVYLQPRLYKSGEVIPPKLTGVETDFCCFILPFGNYLAAGRGLHACVSSWRRISDNAIPPRGKIGGAYVNTGLAMAEAHLNGFDDAIFLTEAGQVAEGSGMNLFIVRKGTVITPGVTDCILEGITRDTVLQLVRDELKMPVEQRQIDRSELYVADEVFFTGTAAQLAPVTQIDHRAIGSGEVGTVTQKLTALYDDVVRGRNKKYSHWLTPVRAHANRP